MIIDSVILTKREYKVAHHSECAAMGQDGLSFSIDTITKKRLRI